MTISSHLVDSAKKRDNFSLSRSLEIIFDESYNGWRAMCHVAIYDLMEIERHVPLYFVSNNFENWLTNCFYTTAIWKEKITQSGMRVEKICGHSN